MVFNTILEKKYNLNGEKFE